MAKIYTLTGPSFMRCAHIAGVYLTREDAQAAWDEAKGIQQDIIKEWNVGDDPRPLGELIALVARLEAGYNYLAANGDDHTVANSVRVMLGQEPLPEAKQASNKPKPSTAKAIAPRKSNTSAKAKPPRNSR